MPDPKTVTLKPIPAERPATARFPRRNAKPRDFKPLPADHPILPYMQLELDRRRHRRAADLEGIPAPGEPAPVVGSFRPDLWPARPRSSSEGGGPPRGRWTAEDLLDRLHTFAAARGEDFSYNEFRTWCRLGDTTVARHWGSWAALRGAAGLPDRPQNPGSRDRGVREHNRHQLLCAYGCFLDRHRRHPQARELAAEAGTSAHLVKLHGGVGHLWELYKLWAGRG